jgi:small subunit ribosomal protein S3
MGRKVHPMGFRIGVIRDWQSKWYDEQNYADYILEDSKLRKAIKSKYADAGISTVEIERHANKVSVFIHTARPGIVIGRSGQRVEEMRRYLETLIGKKIQVDIREIRQPELDAYLVARSVADQMERRVAYRRAMKQAIFRTLQAGAKGMRITCSGRLGGVEIARRQMMHQGRVPLHTLRADIDYGLVEAHTTMGRIGVKVWIYRGDILPEIKIKQELIEDVSLASTETPVKEATVGGSQPKADAEIKKVRAKTKTVETVEIEAPVAAVENAVEEAKPAAEKPKTRTRKPVEAAEAPKPVEMIAEEKPKTRARKPVEAAEAPKHVEMVAEEKPRTRATRAKGGDKEAKPKAE